MLGFVRGTVPLVLTVFAGTLLPAQFATNGALAADLVHCQPNK